MQAHSPAVALRPTPRPDARLNLTQAHSALVTWLAPAPVPSLVTIKRHAALGTLNHCRAADTQGEGRRTLYIWGPFAEHYASLARLVAPADKQPPGDSPQADAPCGPGSEPSRGLTANEVSAILAQALAPLVDQLKSVSREVAGLNATRNSLMAKYDAATAAAHERAHAAESQAKEARRLIDLDGNLARLSANVSRLKDAVDSIVSPRT